MIFSMGLKEAGYRVLTAESGKHGLCLHEHQEVDLIVVDLLTPDMDGLSLIPIFCKMRPAIKIIAISGGSDGWNYLDAARFLGAQTTTLQKPFTLQALLYAVAGQLKSSHP